MPGSPAPRPASPCITRLGNPKGRFRSVMNLSEMLHKGGDTRRALRSPSRSCPTCAATAARLQLGIQLSNIAAYRYWLWAMSRGGRGAATRSSAH